MDVTSSLLEVFESSVRAFFQIGGTPGVDLIEKRNLNIYPRCTYTITQKKAGENI